MNSSASRIVELLEDVDGVSAGTRCSWLSGGGADTLTLGVYENGALLQKIDVRPDQVKQKCPHVTFRFGELVQCSRDPHNTQLEDDPHQTADGRTWWDPPDPEPKPRRRYR